MPALIFAVFALIPTLSLDIPVLFGGPLDSPGTLGLLALCLVFAGVALTYDLSSASPACSRSAMRSTSRSAST